MTAQNSPFEDPDFRHLPHGMEGRFQPGTSAELMQQLAPLLAADGIDVDNLGDVDADELNAAMGRAVQRHNMELNTPVGDDRARTMNAFRQMATALASGSRTLYQEIFDAIGPEPTKTRPSSGHLIGVGLETLDELHTDSALRPAVREVKISKVNAAARAAAQDIVALAAKGRASKSIDSLIRNYGGYEISRAAAYLISATVAAVADHRGAEFHVVLDDLVPKQKLDGGSSQGSAFGAAAARQAASQQYLQNFEVWLRTEAGLADDASTILQPFERLMADAQRAGIDVHQPDQFDPWLVSLTEHTASESMADALGLMQYYLHFRLHTDADPARWNHAYEAMTEILGDAVQAPNHMEEVIASAEQVSPEQRHRALLELPIISGLSALHDWLATPQQVTNTGVPKRADIQTVGAMLGLDVQGVAKLPKLPDRRSVQSALDVPELMSWWWTLQDRGITEVSSTKVQLGPSSAEVVPHDQVPLEQAEKFVSAYVVHSLVHGLEYMPLEALAVSQAIDRLLQPITGAPEQQNAAQEDIRAEIIRSRATEHLRYLETAGLLGLMNDQPTISEALYAPVLRGVVRALQILIDHMDSRESFS